MTEREKTTLQAEEMVRTIYRDNFPQNLDAETVRSVAEKVAKALPRSKGKQKAA